MFDVRKSHPLFFVCMIHIYILYYKNVWIIIVVIISITCTIKKLGVSIWLYCYELRTYLCSFHLFYSLLLLLFLLLLLLLFVVIVVVGWYYWIFLFCMVLLLLYWELATVFAIGWWYTSPRWRGNRMKSAFAASYIWFYDTNTVWHTHTHIHSLSLVQTSVIMKSQIRNLVF